MPDIQSFFHQCQLQIEHLLNVELARHTHISKSLNDAIHYSIFNGGKRFRPSLCYATAIALNAPTKSVDCAAAAIELIHCYSLVHDDLPAIDNDDLRRGKLTCHKAFDEATAILAGDALQAYAFEMLISLNPEIPPAQKLHMGLSLARACGFEGMAAGQELDIANTGKTCSLDHLEIIHRYKTGKMISACIDLSAQAVSVDGSERHQALQHYAQALGLAFQVKDDILDVEGSTEVLGKNKGADQLLNKTTYPSLLGMEAAKEKAEQLNQQALAALKIFGNEANLLREISNYVIHREN
jgi:geranylgeranyl pyrophosphate synthase